MDLDLGSIGSMLTRILPLFDYYITFFTKVLTNFAASLGFDLELPKVENVPAVTPGDAQ